MNKTRNNVFSKTSKQKNNRADMFSREESMPGLDLNSVKGTSVRKHNPFVMGAVAFALVAVPIAGIGVSNAMSNAAEQNSAAMTPVADAENPNATTSTTTTDIRDINKRVLSFSTSAGGHIEPADNADVNGTTQTLSFINNLADASFRTVPDAGFQVTSVKADGIDVQGTDGIYVIPSSSNYTTIVVTYDAVPQPATAAVEATPAPVAQTPEPADNETSDDSSSDDYCPDDSGSDDSSDDYSGDESNYAPDVYTTPATMDSSESETAHEIFDAYNSFRASRGLGTVAWSDTCTNMAYASAEAQSAHPGSLVHREGIPGCVQDSYSDILQYSMGYVMGGDEAVSNWEGSTGHRRQMQCDSASEAGVGVFSDGNGYTYYAIVYNFGNTNVSGN